MISKVYLSGPMTGIADFNYPLFNKVAKELRDKGFEVYNPAEFMPEGADLSDFPVRKAFAEYTKFICEEADIIHLLPGWERSRGAQAEYHLALICGLTVVHHEQ